MSNNYPQWTRNTGKMAELYWMLYFDIQFEEDADAYDFATSFCSDCPRREDEYSRGNSCCKDDERWAEAHHEFYEMLRKMRAVRDAIKEAVEPEYIEQARKEREAEQATTPPEQD